MKFTSFFFTLHPLRLTHTHNFGFHNFCPKFIFSVRCIHCALSSVISLNSFALMKAQWQHNILTTDFSRTGCPPYLWINFKAILGRGHVFLLAIILLKNSRNTNSPRVKGELNFRCHMATFKSFFLLSYYTLNLREF